MDEQSFYLNTIEQVVPHRHEEVMAAFYEFLELEHLYESAAETVKTQLNIYDSEFGMKFQRNPIHGIESRIKSPQSIVEKLQRKGFPISAKSAQEHLMDIAGIRVVCYYVDDIYALAEMLSMRSDIRVLKVKDYIINPKPSGYRSYHMIIMVPVHLSTSRREVPVEIQIRTIAMDFWAALEHQLHYKKDYKMPEDISQELKAIADTITENDRRMQELAKNIPGFVDYSQGIV